MPRNKDSRFPFHAKFKINFFQWNKFLCSITDCHSWPIMEVDSIDLCGNLLFCQISCFLRSLLLHRQPMPATQTTTPPTFDSNLSWTFGISAPDRLTIFSKISWCQQHQSSLSNFDIMFTQSWASCNHTHVIASFDILRRRDSHLSVVAFSSAVIVILSLHLCGIFRGSRLLLLRFQHPLASSSFHSHHWFASRWSLRTSSSSSPRSSRHCFTFSLVYASSASSLALVVAAPSRRRCILSSFRHMYQLRVTKGHC